MVIRGETDRLLGPFDRSTKPSGPVAGLVGPHEDATRSVEDLDLTGVADLCEMFGGVDQCPQ
jgi:hypothetical protein